MKQKIHTLAKADSPLGVGSKRVSKIKLPAFTILELLVGMTLTAILVTASMYAFELIQKQYRLQSRMQDRLDIQANFKARILLDLEKAQSIKRRDKTLLFKNDKSQINYQWATDFITRKNDLSPIAPDTFWIKSTIQESQFQYQIVGSGYIDRCILDIELFETIEQWQFQKHYTTKETYNLESLNF